MSLLPLAAGLLLLQGAAFVAIAVDRLAAERRAADTRERVVPFIEDRQRAALNLERFKRYGDVVVVSEDTARRREALLSAQALAFHPSFHVDPALRDRIGAAFVTLRDAAVLVDRAGHRRVEAASSGLAIAEARRREAIELHRQAGALWRSVASELDVIVDRLSVDIAATTAEGFGQPSDGSGRTPWLAVAGILVTLALAGALAPTMGRRGARPPVPGASATGAIAPTPPVPPSAEPVPVERTLVRASDVLAAVEGRTQDLAGGLRAGGGVRRAAFESFLDGTVIASRGLRAEIDRLLRLRAAPADAAGPFNLKACLTDAAGYGPDGREPDCSDTLEAQTDSAALAAVVAMMVAIRQSPLAHGGTGPGPILSVRLLPGGEGEGEAIAVRFTGGTGTVPDSVTALVSERLKGSLLVESTPGHDPVVTIRFPRRLSRRT
ncbi:hypothetical protein [Azospirillum halopraeferens]|uniref:hypothetical protein n=1 Tax=Azospirillum halopraeferens TaxID=34010 RepID=UPI00048E14A3|nr:hypothetical protein [Azospirillum halopraeferens]